eukprot:813510-Rhodomonas_salina.2
MIKVADFPAVYGHARTPEILAAKVWAKYGADFPFRFEEGKAAALALAQQGVGTFQYNKPPSNKSLQRMCQRDPQFGGPEPDSIEAGGPVLENDWLPWRGAVQAPEDGGDEGEDDDED